MTIKVKLRGNKAIVRFSNQMDQKFFEHIVLEARDNGIPHPKITVKGADNRELPPLKPPKDIKTPVMPAPPSAVKPMVVK